MALDTAITPELKEEGFLREVVSKLQTMRKEGGMEVTDRIRVTFAAAGYAADVLAKNREAIMGEVLAVAFDAGEPAGLRQGMGCQRRTRHLRRGKSRACLRKYKKERPSCPAARWPFLFITYLLRGERKPPLAVSTRIAPIPRRAKAFPSRGRWRRQPPDEVFPMSPSDEPSPSPNRQNEPANSLADAAEILMHLAVGIPQHPHAQPPEIRVSLSVRFHGPVLIML